MSSVDIDLPKRKFVLELSRPLTEEKPPPRKEPSSWLMTSLLPPELPRRLPLSVRLLRPELPAWLLSEVPPPRRSVRPLRPPPPRRSVRLPIPALSELPPP